MKNHKLHHRGAVTHSVIFTDSQIFQYRLQFFVCMFLLLSLSFEINLHKEFCIVSLSTMLVLALDALLSVVFQGHITNACTICLFLLFYPSCHHQKVWYLKVESSPLWRYLIISFTNMTFMQGQCVGSLYCVRIFCVNIALPPDVLDWSVNFQSSSFETSFQLWK